tara:strand:- start:394 stop:630 length:237 start_codon:yes stop_codon:yes gene_type:complete
MFKKKTQYYNILIKSENNKDIKLSLVSGKPIIEAINEFNSHIQDKNQHIKKLYIYNGDQKMNVNLQYKIETDIVVFRD